MDLEAGESAPGEFGAHRGEDGVAPVGHVGRVAGARVAVGAGEDEGAARGAAQDADAQLFRTGVRDGVGDLDGPAHGGRQVEVHPPPAARRGAGVGAVGDLGVAPAGGAVGDRTEVEVQGGEPGRGLGAPAVQEEPDGMGDGLAVGAPGRQIAGVRAEAGGVVGDPALQVGAGRRGRPAAPVAP
ncbi:hypothetical protein SPAR_11930 [Streptomyces sparsogenes DSM 40356]|uniref:Uncharacterized protein n=1 Tax=Streptomyces sparsogenes DSM 40356 TaxID=1331668 RepID=A0A1R1SLQ0_9ACTN|nr:hypothetical protein SPAR_11930 [Streptomyces sparsogenes DSM 40356]